MPTMPNFIADRRFDAPGPHLVLNGHIDVFPVEAPETWTQDPWGAALVDGRIYGRGACDMKCGTTASIFTYLYLSEIAEQLAGRLTLTVVSDEETFGPWGTRYLMEHHAEEVLGDCCLNGEPSSPHTVRFGEKGLIWRRFRVRTPGAHGAFVHRSRNAILIAMEMIAAMRDAVLSLTPDEHPDFARALEESETAMERAYGTGAARVIRSMSFNVGTIRGGVKVNMIAAECTFEIDIRIANGVEPQLVRDRLDAVLARFPEASMEPIVETEPNWCEPYHPMMDIVRENARLVSNIVPPRVVSPGGTDARLWRLRGVPGVVYGPSPNGMGSTDEFVSVEEFLHVVKCHVLSAHDYLARRA
jgi:succinyl-diaminopimelate desuccinylase